MTSIDERSRERVRALLDRFERTYDGFERVEKTWEHSPERYRALVRRFEAGAAGGAGVWITNERGAVLLARNEGDDGWADPGGKVDADETFETAAKREVREETGVDCRITGLCEVHVIENRHADGDEPPVFTAIAVFRGEYTGGKPRPREGEIAAVDWFESPPPEVLYEEVRQRPYPASQE